MGNKEKNISNESMKMQWRLLKQSEFNEGTDWTQGALRLDMRARLLPLDFLAPRVIIYFF